MRNHKSWGKLSIEGSKQRPKVTPEREGNREAGDPGRWGERGRRREGGGRRGKEGGGGGGGGGASLVCFHPAHLRF